MNPVRIHQKSHRLLFLSGVLFLSGLILFSLLDLFHLHKQSLFLGGLFLAFMGMLGLRHYWPSGWGIWQVLLLAVIARCFLLPLTPSDDLNRYLWEGKCQLHAINPFLVPPMSPETEPLRDEIWTGVNHKEFTTIYGPLAQLVFRVSAYFSYSPLTLKIVIVLFDCGTLFLLILILKQRKARLNEALLYAVNPLVLFSFAGEGHMESIMLLMLVAAFYLHQKGHKGPMFVFLGAACFVKVTALMFIPLFVRRDTLRYVPFALVPALLALPFGWSGMLSLLNVTAQFAAGFSFNGCVFSILAPILSNQAALFVCALVFLGIYSWNFFLTPDPVKAGGNIALGFLLTSPTAHPWYFAIIALFLVLYPVRSWIALTGTIGLSWLVSFSYWLTGIWLERFYFLVIEYAPPFVLGIAGRFFRPEYASPGYGIPKTVSLIIPTLNEEMRMRECLELITLPQDAEADIVVVDGGSTDTTCAIAKSDARVKLIASEKGRGIQIAEGVLQSTGDLIIIVHADTRLVSEAIGRIFAFCARHPHVGGGSIATQFNAPGLRFAFISFLNNFRSRFTGISFGDQVQFFRRAALQDALPRVKLMEDIEISMLLKERCVIAVLPCLAKSSTRRWEKRAYAGNMLTVIALTALYLLKRRCGLLNGDNSDFYRMYYGKR